MTPSVPNGTPPDDLATNILTCAYVRLISREGDGINANPRPTCTTLGARPALRPETDQRDETAT